MQRTAKAIKNQRKKQPTPPWLEWWYSLTAMPEAPEHANFVQKELARRSRFFSTIVGGLLIIFFLFIPGCLVVPNPYVIKADLGMMPVCALALFLNRKRKATVAGLLVTIAFEAALTMVVLTSIPFDDPTLQQYELFVFGELLAVSLISPRSVFPFALYNILFITWSLLFQPYKDAHMLFDLQTQFWAIWARPVSVQFLVAVVTFLWAQGERAERARADEAEMVAKLERRVAQQKEQTEREKRELEANIARFVRLHTQATNERKPVKFQSNEFPSLLWPFLGAYNSLVMRLQRARQTENDLLWLQATIMKATEQAQSGRLDLKQLTGTPLDPFFTALQQQFANQLSQAHRQSPKPKEHARQPPAPRNTPQPFHGTQWLVQQPTSSMAAAGEEQLPSR